MIQVRKVLPKDLELLFIRAEEISFDKNVMTNKLENLMIVISSNQVCGIGCGINVGDSCLVNWVHIAESFRRDRLGTALVKTILNNAELNGARTAYLSGSCDEFAAFLKFVKLETPAEINKIEELFYDTFGESFEHNFYKVDLADYFKPCNC